MKLAFYYHVPIHSSQGLYYLPSYLGVFVEELANNVEQLVLVMHEAVGKEIAEADYQLNAANLKLLSLGPKTASWHRSFFYKSTLRKKVKEIENCDALLIRSPSPLASVFKGLLPSTKLFFMIVGDYHEAAEQLEQKSLKNRLLNTYLNYVDKQLLNALPTTDIFVNSTLLYDKYQNSAQSIELIKTTTLKEGDFFDRKSSEIKKPVQLLYTGRIEFTKGLTELVMATAALVKSGLSVHLNIVGWEANAEKNYEKELSQIAKEQGIIDNITFHGKKKLGEELNGMYRSADIYVIPSYHEGFPRTIWEAMANSLPVIATRVGGIPSYLEEDINAILIQPKDISAITLAVQRLVTDYNLRGEMVQNNLKLVAENTLSKQTANLVHVIAQKLK